MFTIRRRGWLQWLDEGGVWRSSRDAARQFATREQAEQAATDQNRNLGFEGDNDDEDAPTMIEATT